MSVSSLVEALGLPAETRVDQRIPKSQLLEHGAPITADKRLIRDGIEQLTWIGSLKPTTIGVPAFRDEAREYLEIEALGALLRPSAKSPRIVELIHRAIPYPVLLIVDDSLSVGLALAHKRRSQGEIGEVVLEEACRTHGLGYACRNPGEQAFVESLALSALPTTNMYVLYEAWFERVVAFQAAAITGTFAVADDAESAAAQRAAVADYARLERELATLRAAAARERQLSRLVELNLEVKRLESELAQTSSAL